MQQRSNTFLAIVISLGILVAWQTIMPRFFPEWFPKPVTETQEAPSGDGGTNDAGSPAGEEGDRGASTGPEETTEGTDTAADSDGVAGETEEGRKDEAGKTADPPDLTRPPVQPLATVTLSNEKVRAVFTNQGAAVASWQLLGEQFENGAARDDTMAEGGLRTKVPVDLVDADKKEARLFATTFKELSWPFDVGYEIVRQDDRSVTFRSTGGGTTVEKTFSLGDEKAYELELSISVTGDQALTPRVLLAQTPPESKKEGGFLSFLTHTMPDVVRPSCAYDEEVERRTYDEDELTFSHTGGLHWVAIDSRYFLRAIYPAGEMPGAGCHLEIPEKNRLRAALEISPIEPGNSGVVEGYLGPKFKTQLAAYGHDLARSIDFGWFGLLSLFLLYIMNFFQGLVGNWGIAIILLTVTVKTVLLPLTNWSMKSMERMRAISPKMKELKAKYGGDQQRFQQEMMKMYREEGVSPFGGCLPMLLQFPIWIALYRTILNTSELYHAGFIAGWLEDLSAPEAGAVKILPLLMGVTMFAMQKMQPVQATGDDSQAKMQRTMVYMMPPFFTLIMYGLPSGLTLYIFVNNLLSIAQQYAIRRKLEKSNADKGTKPAAGAEIEVGKGSQKKAQKKGKSGRKKDKR